MNADAFRHLYGYHFAENRALWERCIAQLSREQFMQPVDYSRGSIRDQFVHLMDADAVWFSELRDVEPPAEVTPTAGDDRAKLRDRWDRIELDMRGYLSTLRDEMLLAQPIREPEEDQVLYVWQVLLHVVNHGTDHRAQLLRVLHDLGVETTSQDYIFYAYDNPLS